MQKNTDCVAQMLEIDIRSKISNSRAHMCSLMASVSLLDSFCAQACAFWFSIKSPSHLDISAPLVTESSTDEGILEF